MYNNEWEYGQIQFTKDWQVGCVSCYDSHKSEYGVGLFLQWVLHFH